VRKLIAAYLDAAKHFVSNRYATLKAQAKKKRNGLYVEADYPSEAELERKFYAEVVFLPVPDAGHIVVDLHNAEIARIQRDTEQMVAQAVEEAQREVWVRLYEPVKNMAAALAVPDRRFNDTLVGNVREIVDLAPKLNLTSDPRVAEIVAEVKKHLVKASAETLRSDPDKRSENAKKAAELARKMAAFMPGLGA
jgi:hypothetical protein